MYVVARELKAMAREMDVAVLLLTQLNDTVEHPRSKRDQLANLPSGSNLGQLADAVIFLYREDQLFSEAEWEEYFPSRPYPHNIAEIVVAKNRNGPVGTAKLRIRNNLRRFDSLPRSEDYEWRAGDSAGLS